MADVRTRSSIAERIDHALIYSLRQWAALCELPAEWAEWDVIEKEVFQLEWSIKEEFLDKLRAWHNQGLLSPEQERRYAELLALVEQYRPVIERLFAEE